MQVADDTVCATWTFWHPNLFGDLFDWLEREDLYNAHTTKAPALSHDQLHAAREYLSEKSGWQEEMMLTVPQRPGDLVNVPPGWLHQVVTTAPCMKVAWDFFRSVQAMPTLASTHSKLLSRFTKPTNAPDYMALQEVVVSLVKTFHK